VASKTEKAHMSKVAALGCIACRQLGYDDTPAELHHIRSGSGAGQRASNYRVIPLCPWHHRQGGHGHAIHAGQAAFEKKFGTEEDLLKQVMEMLNDSNRY